MDDHLLRLVNPRSYPRRADSTHHRAATSSRRPRPVGQHLPMRTQDLRAVVGWSQSDLAVALQWSRQKVQRYEAGEEVPLTPEDEVRLHRLRVLAERRQDVSA
jgi:ribosome-binding protein aMBF1 (putative translation factor)